MAVCHCKSLELNYGGKGDMIKLTEACGCISTINMLQKQLSKCMKIWYPSAWNVYRVGVE